VRVHAAPPPRRRRHAWSRRGLGDLRAPEQGGQDLGGLRADLARIEEDRHATADEQRAVDEDVAYSARTAAEHDPRNGITAGPREPLAVDHDDVGAPADLQRAGLRLEVQRPRSLARPPPERVAAGEAARPPP